MTTQQEVVELVAEVLEQDPETIQRGDHFVTDLGASSLDIVTLVMRIEQHYALGETPDAQLEQIETIGDLIELVESMRSGEVSVVEELVDVAIASDHAGVELKAELVEWLRQRRYTVWIWGPMEASAVDYPDFAELVATRSCPGTPTGACSSAARGSGCRSRRTRSRACAPMVSEPISAELSRRHNDANVLCLGARMIGAGDGQERASTPSCAPSSTPGRRRSPSAPRPAADRRWRRADNS